jgi:hypothetical protein
VVRCQCQWKEKKSDEEEKKKQKKGLPGKCAFFVGRGIKKFTIL